jgi:hypothetical protein
MIIFALLLAVLPTYQLSWHPVPRATSYAIERVDTLDATVWSNDTLCSESYACSTRTYTPECTRMVIKSAVLDSISRCYGGYMNIRFVPWKVGTQGDSVFTETVPVQVRVRAINADGSTPAEHPWTMLTLDWSRGINNCSTYEGNGAMDCTLVKVMLPSASWTVVYSFAGAIPIYVRATCDFDANGDGRLDLCDFVPFGIWWVANGRPIGKLIDFGADYQYETMREWR